MLDKATLLNSLKKDIYCRLRPSGIHGVGVYAIRSIPKGVNVFPELRRYKLVKLRKRDLKGIPTAVKRMMYDYLVEANGDYWVPTISLNEIGIGYFLNHSKTPNVKTDDGFQFVSVRKIRVGEEITADYGSYAGRRLRL